MYFLTSFGKRRKIKNVYKYIIDWDSKSRSKFQSKIKEHLSCLWEGDVVFEEFPVVGSKMTIDFYNATQNIAIEVDGEQHNSYNPHFHNKSKMNFLRQLKRDQQKEDFCCVNKISLVRITPDDIVDSPAQLLKLINEY